MDALLFVISARSTPIRSFFSPMRGPLIQPAARTTSRISLPSRVQTILKAIQGQKDTVIYQFPKKLLFDLS